MECFLVISRECCLCIEKKLKVKFTKDYFNVTVVKIASNKSMLSIRFGSTPKIINQNSQIPAPDSVCRYFQNLYIVRISGIAGSHLCTFYSKWNAYKECTRIYIPVANTFYTSSSRQPQHHWFCWGFLIF